MVEILQYVFSYGAPDWEVFATAVKVFFSGGNPYTVIIRGDEWLKVFEPPWTYLLLGPFTLLPYYIGRIAVMIVGMAVFAFSAVKMGAKPYQMALFLLSHPVIGSLFQGNIDWLVTAGLWMPPSIGLFFVLMKPQIGIGVAVYWAYMAWLQGGWKKVVQTFMPVTIAYLASFLVYGFWVSNMFNMPNNPASISIFPIGAFIGAYLLYEGLRLRQQALCAIASPLFAPYMSFYNLSGALLSMFDRPRLFITAWILLWIPMIVHYIL